MAERLKLDLPDWRRWLADRARHAARDAKDYDAHLAAVEWALSSALDINRLEDFVFGLLYVTVAFNPDAQPLDKAFLDGLREHGYAVGRNLVIEVRSAYGKSEQRRTDPCPVRDIR